MPLHRQSAVTGAALLGFRSPPDIFAANGKKAAQRKRDAAIPDASAFDAAPHLCIELRWGKQKVRQIRDGGQWADLCILPDKDD